VGNAELKNGAVTASKLHAHSIDAAAVVGNSLTGKQIDESSLGAVPHAALADSATSAKTAETAKTATRATTADMAVNAATAVTANGALLATTADDANLLGGAAPATYKMSCPSAQSYEWSTDVYVDTSTEVIVLGDDSSRNDSISTAAAAATLPFRCVSTPTNNG
jgi:hypothetical protein